MRSRQLRGIYIYIAHFTTWQQPDPGPLSHPSKPRSHSWGPGRTQAGRIRATSSRRQAAWGTGPPDPQAASEPSAPHFRPASPPPCPRLPGGTSLMLPSCLPGHEAPAPAAWGRAEATRTHGRRCPCAEDRGLRGSRTRWHQALGPQPVLCQPRVCDAVKARPAGTGLHGEKQRRDRCSQVTWGCGHGPAVGQVHTQWEESVSCSRALGLHRGT